MYSTPLGPHEAAQIMRERGVLNVVTGWTCEQVFGDGPDHFVARLLPKQ